MIGLVLAAGKGSRLEERTTNLPKSLLPLSENLTLMDYQIQTLQQIGVDKIMIVTGFEADQIEKHLADNSSVNFIYNPFWNHCNVLGSLYSALPYLDEDFLFLHADTLVDLSIWKELKDADGDIVLPYVKKPCGDEEMKVRIDDEGNLLEINKEMDPISATGEFLGIAKFSQSSIRYISETARNLFKKGNLNQYMEAIISEAITNSSRVIRTLDIKEARFIEVDFDVDYQMAKKLFGVI